MNSSRKEVIADNHTIDVFDNYSSIVDRLDFFIDYDCWADKVNLAALCMSIKANNFFYSDREEFDVLTGKNK